MLNKVENVQRYYTKRLDKLWCIPYNQRLIIMFFDKFGTPQTHADLILCFKIVRNLIDLILTQFFEFDLSNRTRGRNLKLLLPKFETHSRQQFFCVRICPVWNSLPSLLVNCNSLMGFKCGLIKINLFKYLLREY